MERVVWIMVCLVMFMLRWESTSAQMAPALFVFGDSLVDVGNNNHLPLSIVKADFPHNGIDFPNHKATGRFTNGKNAADFLADSLGLPSSPPYLSMVHDKSENFVTGVNFASGGAGILDGTDQLYKQSITMNRQIDYFAAVHKTMMQQMGESSATKTLSKSVFAIVIGSNDILDYFGSGSSPLLKHSKKGTPQELVDSMLVASTGQLKRIYDLGARKIAILGISAVGCCPSQRDLNKTEVCNEEANFWATKYNQGLQLALQDFQTEHKDFQYTYFDTYTVLLNLIRQPATYGFKEEKAACCGLGELNAKLPCLPISGYCHNRSDHIFWDLYHPTEAAARIIIDTAFDGPKQYAFPVNVRQLASA